MRKPRSDSKLLNLPKDQKDQILDWMLGGMSYVAVRDMVSRELGIKSSVASLGGFYAEEAPKRLIERRLESLTVAHEIAQETEKRPAQFDKAATERISQIAFELAINPQASPGDIKTFFNLVLKARDQDLEARRVALLEEKAKQAEKANGVLQDSKLSEAEKQIRLKQIFGAA